MQSARKAELLCAFLNRTAIESYGPLQAGQLAQGSFKVTQGYWQPLKHPLTSVPDSPLTPHKHLCAVNLD